MLAVTGGKERVALYVKRYAPALPEHIDFDGWVARLHQRKSEIYSELVHAGAIPLRPGIARLINELKANGVRLAVATTTTPSSLNSLIVANFGCDMDSLFEVIGAGDRVVNKKPTPDVYQWVLQQLQLPAAACLAIEDSFPGLSAAHAAGLPALITVNDYTANDDFSGALSVVSDLGEPDAPAHLIDGWPLKGFWSLPRAAVCDRWCVLPSAVMSTAAATVLNAASRSTDTLRRNASTAGSCTHASVN